jgi:hypothetical protein
MAVSEATKRERQRANRKRWYAKNPGERPSSKRWRVNNPERQAYNLHRNNAKRRGIPFLLTFEQWNSIWRESGKWDQRGKRKGQYCMARHGDTGPYADGNVKITTKEENQAESTHPLQNKRRVIRNGCDVWANPDDWDYPGATRPRHRNRAREIANDRLVQCILDGIKANPNQPYEDYGQATTGQVQ